MFKKVQGEESDTYVNVSNFRSNGYIRDEGDINCLDGVHIKVNNFVHSTRNLTKGAVQTNVRIFLNIEALASRTDEVCRILPRSNRLDREIYVRVQRVGEVRFSV